MKLNRKQPDPAQTKGELRELSRLTTYLAPYRWAIVGAIFAMLAASATILSFGIGLRFLVDQGFQQSPETWLDNALMALFGVVAILAVATFVRFYLVSWVGERVVADLRRVVYNHLINLSPIFFETTKTGELLSRLTTDTTLLQIVIGGSVSVVLRNALLLLGGTIMLAVTSPKLTALVLILVPAVVIPFVVFGRHVHQLSRESQDRVALVAAHAEESVNAVRTVQAFDRQELERAVFTERVEEAFDASIQRVRARALLTTVVMVTVFSATGLVLWIGGNDVMDRTLTVGELSQFIFFAIVVAGALGSISEVYGDLQRAAGATVRLMELLATAPDIRAPETPVALPEPSRGEVVFDQVRFAYPARPQSAAIDDFSLHVKPGQTIALVGPSGAGKSTLFQLLLRFYDPESGTVKIDGIDLRQTEPSAVRQRIALVPQEPVIFSADVWTNIRYGRPDATEAEIREAARVAAAASFVEQLPNGYDSFLGERGIRLSVGQRQRIAIARAILRDPAILLLDEATSALDAENERLVQRALTPLMHNRTTLVIAHRLATVLRADQIVVMDEGRIVASGTHQTLSEQDGLYARLAALQFRPGAVEDELPDPGPELAHAS